ncbi:MAG: HEPN domain-containing protein [Ignavibacteria bacterium]|nr:HEPN domain-containing protein [Ignavibacteria bacterium]
MDEAIRDLANYRLEKAFEELKNSAMMIESGSFSKSLNCSYYVIFHATRDLLAFDKFDSRKHSGIISFFINKYIKSKLIDEELAKIIMGAQNYRIKSDHLDFFIVSKSESIEQYENAKRFVDSLAELINEKLRD